MVVPRLGRRPLLLAAAGLALGACARAPAPARPAGRSASSASHSAAPPSSSGSKFPVAVPGTAAERASFAAWAPGLDPRPFAVPAGAAPRPEWAIASAQPFEYPAGSASVDAALHTLNFDPATLLAGVFAPFKNDAFVATRHYAVPAFAIPWGVQYDASVFQAVHLGDPPPDWTLDDFETCCAVIAGAIQAGRLPHIQSVLPLLLGEVTEKVQFGGRTIRTTILPTFLHPVLQDAFVVGFGGTAVADGRFALTDGGAVAGLQRMVDLAARYQPHGAQPPLGPTAMAFSAAAAVRSLSAGAQPAPLRNSKTWRWARFPAFPVRPLVPVGVGGITAAKDTAAALSSWPPAGAPEEALLAAGQYAMWFLQWTRANPALPHLPPPVLADSAAQKAYWSAPGRAGNGYAAVGDWQHYYIGCTNWPMVLNGPAAPLISALSQAVQAPGTLPALLAKAAQQLNNGLGLTKVGRPAGTGSASAASSGAPPG